MSYELRLDQRRSENLAHVDRYVPVLSNPPWPAPLPLRESSGSSAPGPFPFDDLPKEAKEKIIDYLLVKDDPIVIDFTWMRPFVNGHARIPAASKSVKVEEGISYSVPVSWNRLIEDIDIMKRDCLPFGEALVVCGNKNRRRKGPCRQMTTGLLMVSKAIHSLAAPIFYGQNIFHFPWATSAWMQLESFLATIGTSNVNYLRSISIHVPLWHRGVQEDYVEGAILDLTSPASRFGVVKPAARDRLLSAIKSAVYTLLRSGKLTHLAFDLDHGMNTDRWSGRYHNDRQLILVGAAEEHIARKQQGIALLKKLGDSLPLPHPPQLSLYHPSAVSKIQKHDLSEFRTRLAGVMREAEQYGWQVNSALKGKTW